MTKRYIVVVILNHKRRKCMILKSLRQKHGLSQEELANEIGVARTTIAMIEIGKNQMTVDMAKRLSKVFDIDWKDFFND